MAIKSYKVGPGTLALGEAGTAIDATSQVTSARVTWAEDVEDSVVVLSGETLDGAATYTATLAATFVQDLTEGGLVDFTWDHKGEVLPFVYTPATAADRAISGAVRIGPMDVGGDVGSKPTSDVEWACIGEPTLGVDLT